MFGSAAYADGHGSVYLVDFKCIAAAYVEFASMTLEELNAQFRKALQNLRGITTLRLVAVSFLIETDDPTLAIRHVNPWTSMCDATITPVVDDKSTGNIAKAISIN